MTITTQDIIKLLKAINKYVHFKTICVLLLCVIIYAFVIKPDIGFSYIEKWMAIATVEKEQKAFDYRNANFGTIQDKLENLRLRLRANILVIGEFHNSNYSVGNLAPYMKISAKYVAPKEARSYFIENIKDRPIDANGITNYILHQKGGCSLVSREELLEIDNSTWVSREESAKWLLYHTYYVKGIATGQIIAIYHERPHMTEKDLIVEIDKMSDEIITLLYYQQ